MEGIIEIHGEIGSRVTYESVKAQIDPNAKSHTLYLHSEGGEVYEGLKIYHLLNNLPNLTVVVEGLAASIASVIMQAGSKIIALRPSQVMIHNPFGEAKGESKDMRAVAAQLDRIKSIITSVYKKRPKIAALPDTALDQMMDNATFMDADQALAAGFIDEVRDELKAVAKLDLTKSIMADENKEVKGMFDQLMKRFDDFTSLFKAKNVIAETLADGGEITVQAEEGEDITGKPVMVNGAPAEAKEYKLVTGEVWVVGEGSTISAVKEAEIQKTEEETPEEMENKQLAEAKAQIEQLKKELEAKTTEATAANKSVAEVTAAVNSIKTEFAAFKNSLDKEVFGENGKPPLKPRNQEDTKTIEDDIPEEFSDFHNHVRQTFLYANRNLQ